MERDLAHDVTLARGALLRLQDGQDLVITVQRGSVWVTQENDPDDTVLGSGERFTLDRPGLASSRGCVRAPSAASGRPTTNGSTGRAPSRRRPPAPPRAKPGAPPRRAWRSRWRPPPWPAACT